MRWTGGVRRGGREQWMCFRVARSCGSGGCDPWGTREFWTRAKARDRTAGFSGTGWLSEGEKRGGSGKLRSQRDRASKGSVHPPPFKILTFPQISAFSQGTRESQCIPRWAGGEFPRPGAFCFPPFLSFPLLQIFQAFSAKGAFFALLT